MSTFHNAGVLFLGGLAAKIVTFTLNQLLIQYTTPDLLGTALLVDFVHDYTFFLSTESVRLSIARLDAQNSTQFSINFSYLSSLIYVVISPVVIYWKIFLNDGLPFRMKVILGGVVFIATLIQILNEVYYNLNQYIRNDVSKRTKIESLASFAKCFLQFVSTYYFNDYLAGYLVGLLSYSLMTTLLYANLFGWKRFQVHKYENHYFPQNSWQYFKNISIQNLFKIFLTIGDKLIITSILPLSSQGYYSFISNYGSLLARLLFAPIEESIRLSVTKLFKEEKFAKSDFQSLASLLNNVIKIYFYLLTLLVIYAPLNTDFLLSMVFPKFFNSQTSSTFKLYWFYLILLAINGITEALFQSIFSSPKDVKQYSKFMLVNSLLFVASLFAFIRLYELNGLLYSNMLNMILRISYCIRFIKKFISEKHYTMNLSHYFPVFMMATSVVMFHWFILGPVDNFKKFLVSAISGIILVLAMIFNERSVLKSFIQRTHKKAE